MASNHTSVYMRGLFDGLREGMQKEMTPKKFKLTLDSMTTISRKVFEAVPIQESWTANQIVTALARTTSTRPDLKTATGCLDTLKQCGLVKETERGLFRQVVPREQISMPDPLPVAINKPIDGVANTIPPEAAPDFTKPEPVYTPALAREATPATIFGAMADVLRKQSAALLKMADDIDAGALAFEQDIEDANKRLERFNQLKALLTS